jgi:ClpP class serine protease
MPWLLKKESADELVALRRELLPAAAAANPSPRVAYASAKESGKVVAGADAVMAIEDGVAEIRVEGVLTAEPDPCAWFFGVKSTAYSDIIAALAQASADDAVKSVLFRIDSPGGMVDGLFDALGAIQAFAKPMSVLANQACSAAYAIAAVAGKIKATNAAASFGSIGVAASIRLDPEVLDLASTEAPDKRPDLATDEGKAVVVRYLDAIHDLFVDAIADGRGMKAEDVNSTFGRCATLLAGEAKRLGMIDDVVQPLRVIRGGKSSAADSGSDISQEREMDLKTLKAQHPQLVEDLLAEGRTQGTNGERERAVAHLTMGKQAGPKGMEIAVAAIESGEGFGVATQAKYLSVAMNQRDTNARQADSDAAGEVVNAAQPTSATTHDLGDAIVALMDAQSGKKTTNG